MIKFILFLMTIPVLCFAGITADNSNVITVPGFKLQLDQEAPLTDKNGVVILSQIINVPIGKSVLIYRTDGFCYKGTITEIEQGDNHYKLYGKINNVDETSFGFVMVKGGNFAGAILEGKTTKTYVLEFNLDYKGFIFVRSNKYDKPSA
jgi:hypothetical protein